MNATKKSILTVALTLAVCTLFAGSALASSWPYDVTTMDTLKTYLTGESVGYKAYTGPALSGSYFVTPLAYEAGDTIRLQNSPTDILFTNKNLATEFGTVKSANLSSAYFYDVDKNTSFYASNSRVTVLELISSWTLSSGLKLDAGTFILGLNDTGSGDCDYDDFILAASKTAPTPLPAAVWLLGSGLLGVMGFKRTRKGERA
ncbi:MAG: VPLPA-CTERM sorting domain-containing protein [Proteobacteria bacterium]|nr:VPLPA-CTERM sorting domain-containing protein [Pseudomonadota bacterium]MBU1595310.1 VPLPA-CTERM sorting domain-containing protein [Pseudomonadota bacterium]